MTHSLILAMRRYSIDSRTRKYVKGYHFLSFVRKYKKQLLNTGLDYLKTASKKVVDQTGEFLENKINKIVKQEHVEELIIPPE